MLLEISFDFGQFPVMQVLSHKLEVEGSFLSYKLSYFCGIPGFDDVSIEISELIFKIVQLSLGIFGQAERCAASEEV